MDQDKKTVCEENLEQVSGGAYRGLLETCPNCCNEYRVHLLRAGSTFKCGSCGATLYWNGKELAVLE